MGPGSSRHSASKTRVYALKALGRDDNNYCSCAGMTHRGPSPGRSKHSEVLSMPAAAVEGVRPATHTSREEIMAKRETPFTSQVPDVAGNGLLDRRALLGRGVLFAGAAATGAGASLTSAAAEPLKDDPWSQAAGSVSPAYEQRSKFEQERVNRILSNPITTPAPRTPVRRTTSWKAPSRRTVCTSPLCSPSRASAPRGTGTALRSCRAARGT